MKSKLFSLLILFMLVSPFLLAQDKPIAKDSVSVYRNIEKYSQKRKFTKFFHRLVFRPVQRTPSSKLKTQTQPEKNRFKEFECKIIRNISIETLDPFGHTLDNPNRKPKRWTEKTGNTLHMKSRIWAIKNYLLFKKNQPLDSLLIKESERLLQQQFFVRNVSITPIDIKQNSDSVDITIKVLDAWSLIPNGSISTSRGNFELTERNFLGMGHEFENNFRQRFSDNQNGYGVKYFVPNIYNSFITTTINYNHDFDNNYNKSVRLDRSFFSPYTRWAAGVALEQRFYKDSLFNQNSEKAEIGLKYNSFDFWGGHSFRLFKGKSELNRISNLVTTLGYSQKIFIDVPPSNYNPQNYYANSKLYLVAIGISSRKFVETKFLFNNGITEYVQIGKNYSFTNGFENKNHRNRTYFGGRFSFGGFYKTGYYSAFVELGTFVNNRLSEQTTFRLQGLYFSNLLEAGKWKFRQFVNSEILIGNNRLPINEDILTLNKRNGIAGLSNTINGTKRLQLTLQTQSYIPGNFGGFRLSPFFNASFGMIGDNTRSLLNSRLYSKIGLGVLFSNDYMVFNSFQISLAYYPTIPGEGTNLLKSDTFKNNDIELPDFQVGKPHIIPFQ